MTTVDQALAAVLELAQPPQPETVALADALGRVMLEPAVSRMTQPPFDAASMDGYAVRSADTGPLRVVGEAAAGHPWHGQAQPGTALRIFTGAPVPAGYDRVVMQEQVTRQGDQITIAPDASPKSNIRTRGNDFAEGQSFHPDRPLRPADLGLLAAMNVPQVTVARRPVVAILSGGDELVLPGETPGPGQIICSNDLAVAGIATQAGAIARILPLARDTRESLLERFRMAADADLIVTTAGASVGDHDLIGAITDELGMKRSFYKIAMRPGRPLIAGRLGRQAMLGLPGNPVSAITCGMIFMQPLIRAMQGLRPQPVLLQARLGAPMPPEGDRQHYQRARVEPGPDLPVITTFADQDSARLRVMADANALLMRPANDPARQAGDVMHYIPLP